VVESFPLPTLSSALKWNFFFKPCAVSIPIPITPATLRTSHLLFSPTEKYSSLGPVTMFFPVNKLVPFIRIIYPIDYIHENFKYFINTL